MENNEKKDLLHRNLVVNKKVVMIALLALFISVITPIGYAWFTSTVSGNNTAGVNSVSTPTGLSLVLTDGPEVSGTNWVPGNSLEKTFTVKNNSATTLKYYITLADLVNNFSDKTDLVYKLESSDGGYNMTSSSEMISKSGVISELVTIGSQVTHTYKLTITFKYLDEDQSDNMGKSFAGKVNVIDEHDYIEPSIPISEKMIALKNSGATDLEYDGVETLGNDFGTLDNNLRYVGPRYGNSNPKNFVYFNCSTTNPSEMNDSTCEKWRIIGLFNNIEKSDGTTASLIKIMRNIPIGNYSWDSSTSPSDDSHSNYGYGINQWGESTYENGTTYEGADLMRELNTDYLGHTTVGTDGYWYNNRSNEKTAAIPSTTLNQNAQNMIEEVKWNLGSGVFSDDLRKTKLLYDYERGTGNGKTCPLGNICNDTVVRTTYWVGKVALFYPSDYGYATSGGSKTNKETCLSTSLYLWNGSKISDCKNNSWILYSSNQWTLSPTDAPESSAGVFIVSYDGKSSSINAINAYAVRPTIFLKSSVSINSGEGTELIPYKLVLE